MLTLLVVGDWIPAAALLLLSFSCGCIGADLHPGKSFRQLVRGTLPNAPFFQYAGPLSAAESFILVRAYVRLGLAVAAVSFVAAISYRGSWQFAAAFGAGLGFSRWSHAPSCNWSAIVLPGGDTPRGAIKSDANPPWQHTPPCASSAPPQWTPRVP